MNDGVKFLIGSIQFPIPKPPSFNVLTGKIDTNVSIPALAAEADNIELQGLAVFTSTLSSPTWRNPAEGDDGRR
jgi:hypothetical protein